MGSAASIAAALPLTPLTTQEDDVVRRMVALHGARQWSVIAEELPGRVGKQCRERCEMNFPSRLSVLKRAPWR